MHEEFYAVHIILNLIKKVNWMSQHYFDLCFLTYSDLSTDGRSLNFINSFKKIGLSVCDISITYEKQNKSQAESFLIYLKKDRRLLYNWQKYIREIKKHRHLIKSKIYFATDLYSLAAVISIADSDSKIIYDSREIFSALGTLQERTFKQFALSQLELYFSKKVDKFVVTGELDAEYLSSYFNVKKPFFVVKNYPSYRQSISNTNYLRNFFNIPKTKRIMLYQGVLLEGRGIVPMMKFLKLTDKYVFCIVGDGKSKEKLQNLAKIWGIEDKVFFHPAVDYNNLYEITVSADIGISLIEPITFSYELALPNKLFEYLQAGLPVLISDLPAMKKEVETYNVGEIIPISLTAADIHSAVEKLEQNYSIYKKNAVNIQNNISFESQYEIIKQVVQFN